MASFGLSEIHIKVEGEEEKTFIVTPRMKSIVH
jgi:hypothetical protein